MSFLNSLQSVRSELAILPKYYYHHLWITTPSHDGLSFVGLSDFAKNYFVRFNKINFEGYAKTNYAMQNRFQIQAFISDTQSRKDSGQLKMSQKIEWDRFLAKQGEPFVTLETVEFDVELLAPVDMRVFSCEFQIEWSHTILTAPYLFQVQALAPFQLSTLMTEQQYLSSRKMFKLAA